MKRYALILALIVLGGFVMVEVFQEELDGDEASIVGGDTDLLGVDDPADEGAALTARGTKKAAGADAAYTEIDLFADVPAEVHGGTKGGGSVRGRVVRAKGGVPMAGVRVTLGRYDSLVTYLRAQANGRFDALEARTGKDGRFAFLDVTPSKGYVVRARHVDFAIASSDDDLDLTGRDAIDVGDLALGAGATLTGKVTDQDGRPLPKVRVIATWRISNPIGIILSDPATAPELEREVTTGADGRFTLEKLDPQAKTIFAIAPSGAAQVVRSVSLDDGQMKAMDDIRMPGDGVLAGHVVWADGTPIQGARVFGAPQMQAAVRTVEADAEGAFRLTWLPEGEDYVIGVLVQGLPVSLTMGLALGEEDARIEFPVPGRIAGVVVTADGGQPVTQFALRLDDMQPSPNMQMRFVEEQVKRGLGPTPFRSDAGAFELPRVAAGAYKITVVAAGYPEVTVENIVVVAGEVVEARLELPRGHAARGVVRKADGKPFAGARVYVVRGVPASSEGPALGTYIRERAPDTVAGADGTFEVPAQTPGRYQLIAAHPSALAGILRGVDLTSGDSEGLEIRLPPSATIRGRLLDEAARPVEMEQVYVVYRDGMVRTAWTEEDGRFEIAGLPVGRCIVRWLSLLDTQAYRRILHAGDNGEQREKAYDDLRQKHGEHDLRDGAVVQAALRIPSRTKVTGHYRIAGEAPPNGKRYFYVTVEGGGNFTGVELDDGGAYETRLLPGTYLIYGPTTQGGLESQTIEIPNAATHTLDIDVE